jgi:hypothetical protein
MHQQTRDLMVEAAFLYASHGNLMRVACVMEQRTGRSWSMTSVKQLLTKYIREQMHIRID